MKNLFLSVVSAICAVTSAFSLTEEEIAGFLEKYDDVLVTGDTKGDDSSFANPGHWHGNAVPKAGKTYYVPAGMRINDPSGRSSYTFPGTLVLAGYIQAMCSGGFTLTYQPLRMLNGSEYRWSSFNFMAGDVYIDSDADDPAKFAVFYHHSANEVRIGASFYGGEDNVVMFARHGAPTANSWIPGVRYAFGGSFAEYYGTVVIASNALFEVNNNSTGNAKLKVERDGYFRVNRGSGTLTVRSLDLQEGAHFELIPTYQLGAGTAPVYVTEKLKIGNGVKLDGFESFAKVTSSDYRLALFRLSDEAVANGVDLPDTIELPEAFFGLLPKKPRFEIADDESGTKTLYIAYDPMLAVVKTGATAPGGNSAFTPGNDDFWDPAGIPDSNTNADIMVGMPILWPSGKASWPNARFILASTAYIQNLELNANLYVCPGGSIMNYGNDFDFTLLGTMTLYPGAKNSTYTIFNRKNVYIRSEISGSGNVDFNTWHTGGYYHLFGTNDNFSGKMSFGVKLEADESMEENVSRVHLYDPRSLGGACTAADAHDATKFGDGFTVVVEDNDIALDKRDRGVKIQGNVGFAVGEGRTFAIDRNLTFSGVLTKTGGGVLSLGGAARFIDGDVATEPVENTNRLVVAEGALRVTSTNALDGVQTEFAAGTGLVLAVDPAAEGMAAYGIVCGRWSAPFVSSGPIRVFFEDRGNALASRPAKRSTAVCTVPAAAAENLEFEFMRVPGYRVSGRRRENADGTVTFVADLEARGMTVILR